MTSLKAIGLLILITLVVSLNIHPHNTESSSVHRAGEHARAGGDVSNSIENELKDKFDRWINLLGSSEEKAIGVLLLDSQVLDHETELVSRLGPLNKKAV